MMIARRSIAALIGILALILIAALVEDWAPKGDSLFSYLFGHPYELIVSLFGSLGQISFTPTSLILIATLVVVPAAVAGGILLAFHNRPAAFENLYSLAMLIAVGNVIFILVRAFLGGFGITTAMLAVVSGLVSAFCIFYGFWGITEGAEAAEPARRQLTKQREMSGRTTNRSAGRP